jgi:DNA-binding transcriptional MerR regulator
MKQLVKIGSKAYKVYTIGELAKKLDRQPSSIRKMEERKILPKANYRLPDITMCNGKIREGQRIYTEALVEKIVHIFRHIQRGVKVSDMQKMELKNAFAQELELLNL